MADSPAAVGAQSTPTITLPPVIASSNHYLDLEPYCTKIWQEEPRKWSEILPWEFPQKADQKVEEDFLRNFFDETECHVQGFRFLKQVWYSIAIYNFEKRIPAIAQWWWQQEDHASWLHDPMMLKFIRSPDATPETFFLPAQLEAYGAKLLGEVVKQIQWQTEQPETVKEASESTPPIVEPVTQPLVRAESVAPVIAEDTATIKTVKCANRRSSAAAQSTIPFPPYQEPVAARVLSAEFNPAFHSQPNGRKRGQSFNKRHNGRGGQYRQQGNVSGSYNNQQTPALFDPNAPSNTTPMTAQFQGRIGSATRVSNRPPAINTQNMPPQFDARRHGFPTPQGSEQFMSQASSHVAFSSPYPSPFMPMTPSASTDMQASGMPYGNNFVPGQEQFMNPGLVNEYPVNGFYDSSNRQNGDYRRTSMSSRGGTFASRGGSDRSRGGRFREEGRRDVTDLASAHYARKPSYDSNHKTFNRDQARRGSGLQNGSWRGNSAYTRGEADFANRVFLDPAFPQTQGAPFSGPFNGQRVYQQIGPNSRPPSAVFPPANGRFAGTSDTVPYGAVNLQAGHNAPLAGPPMPVAASDGPENQVDEFFIGLDRAEIRKLLVFNIPLYMRENEVGNFVYTTAGVGVAGVSFLEKRDGPSPYRHALIVLQSHIDARRVLEVRNSFVLDGTLLDVKVPKEYWDKSHYKYVPYPPAPGEHSATFQSTGQVTQIQPPRSKTPPFGSSQDARFSMDEGTRAGNPRANLGYQSKMQQFVPPLPTLKSEHATPTPSSTTTPKKSKSKKNKRAAQSTPVHPALGGNPKDSVVLPQAPTADKTTKQLFSEKSRTGVQPKRQPESVVQSSSSSTPKEETTRVDSVPSSTLQPENLETERSPATAEPGDLASETSKLQGSPSAVIQDLAGQKSPGDRIGEETFVDVKIPLDEPTVQADAPRSDQVVADQPSQTPAAGQDSRPTSPKSGRAVLPSPTINETRPSRTRVESDNVDDSFHTACDSPQTANKSPPAEESARDPPIASTDKPLATNEVSSDDRGTKASPSKESHVPAEPAAAGSEDIKMSILAAPRSTSGNSVPPMPAFETAPTTSAIPESPKQSQTQSQVPKTKQQLAEEAEKLKGPSQTESFSMFAKSKQKKKSNKQPKGKGSIKGKPQEANLLSIDTSRVASSKTTAATPPVNTNESKAKPSVLAATGRDKKSSKPTVKTEGTRKPIAEKEQEVEEIITPASQSRGLTALIGNWFPLAKKPSEIYRTDAPRDTSPQNSLTDSKALLKQEEGKFSSESYPAETPQDPVPIVGSSGELGDPPAGGNEEVAGNIEGTMSSDVASASAVTTPKKKKKSKSKAKKKQSTEKNDISDDTPAIPTVPSTPKGKGKERATSPDFQSPTDEITPSNTPRTLSTPSQKVLDAINARGSSSDNLVKGRPPLNLRQKRPVSNRTGSETASQSSSESTKDAVERHKKTELGKAQLKTLRLINYQGGVQELLMKDVKEENAAESGGRRRPLYILAYEGEDGGLRVPAQDGEDYPVYQIEAADDEEDDGQDEDGEEAGSEGTVQDSETGSQSSDVVEE